MRKKVRDVMTTDVVSVRPDATFKEVVEDLTYHDVSSVPVVDEQGRLVGIVSEGDILSKEAGRTRGGQVARMLSRILERGDGEEARRVMARTAADLMTANPVSVSPDDELRATARLMARRNLKRLPVLDGGRLVGILSRHDILDVFDRPDDDLRAELEEFLARCLYVPPENHIQISVSDGVVGLSGDVSYPSDAKVLAALVEGYEGVVGVEMDVTARLPEPRVTA